MKMSQTTKLLGYPDDARLLIINADDFGMCHGITEAIFRSLKEGVVQSTTLMTPCPWALHAMNLLRENPDLAFGVHLTLICDSPVYRWRPLTSREKVPSLIDETGYFYAYQRIPEFLAQAKLDEVEVEFRAQIETVLAAGLTPTHLDWHCLHSGGREDIFDMTVGLGKEYGLALRVAGQPWTEKTQRLGLPATDHEMLDSFSLNTVGKSVRYTQMLRELPVGLTEWAVHPGLDTPELLIIEPGPQRVRQTDYDFLMSQEAREIIEQEGIILLNYRRLQEIWQAQ
jgi:chitin disaccharide deacetylase